MPEQSQGEQDDINQGAQEESIQEMRCIIADLS